MSRRINAKFLGSIFAIIRLMFFTDLLGWWYGAGFKDVGRRFNDIFASTVDFFSIDILAKSLFQPFRQTLTTSNYKRTLGQKIGDALVSRTIGFLTRFFLILFGALALVAEVLVMAILYITWPLVPLLPIAMVVLSLTDI